MLLWLHRLLSPHCPDCQLAAMENKVCQSCETLKMQLSIANIEKKQLLESILSLTRPAEVQPPSAQVNPKDAAPKMMTWNVRRQMLEAEDRKNAQVLAEQRKSAEDAKKAFIAANPLPSEAPSAIIEDRTQSIEQLEKELGIDEEVKESA